MSSVSVPVIADDVIEGKETFHVSLSSPSLINKGIIIGDGNTATVTITDSTSEYIQIFCVVADLPLLCSIYLSYFLQWLQKLSLILFR